MIPLRVLLVAVWLTAALVAQPQPSFFHRQLPATSAATTAAYLPLFGAGDPDAAFLKAVVRFGQLGLSQDGAFDTAGDPAEEQVWVVLEGSAVLQYQGGKLPLRKHDFVYLPPGLRHHVANASATPTRILIGGFRVSEKEHASGAPLSANFDDVPKQTVGGHPASTLYQLLMGDTHSTRDRLAAARSLTSLYTMEFTPEGTNIPHRHEHDEEIYLVLNGQGNMVTGSDAKGGEVRQPARAGDVFLFRPGCLVGFYSTTPAAEGKARILAMRIRVPE